jgi:hypothetical protein
MQIVRELAPLENPRVLLYRPSVVHNTLRKSSPPQQDGEVLQEAFQTHRRVRDCSCSTSPSCFMHRCGNTGRPWTPSSSGWVATTSMWRRGWILSSLSPSSSHGDDRRHEDRSPALDAASDSGVYLRKVSATKVSVYPHHT